MEPSEHLDRLLRLGQKLLKELDPGSDTLQQWMIHYIAGLIEVAVHASGEQKQEAERRCSEAILDLWKNQSEHGKVSGPVTVLCRSSDHLL